MSETKRDLPTLLDLVKNPEEAYKSDMFKHLLNQPPIEKWLKAHPLAKVKNEKGENVPARYLPTDKVEWLLDWIFQEWRVEVLSTMVIFQSVAITVRIHYKNPTTGEWSFHDGVGASVVQSNSGQTFSADSIKASGVQMALPAAKSYAIKDACDHLGKLFGRDINRRSVVEFVGAYSPVDKKPAQTDESRNQQRLELLITNAKTVAALEKLKDNCKTDEQIKMWNSKLNELQSKK